jgi:hypothetical protein
MLFNKRKTHFKQSFFFTCRLNTSRLTTNRSVAVVVITVALRGSSVTRARSPKSKPLTRNVQLNNCYSMFEQKVKHLLNKHVSCRVLSMLYRISLLNTHRKSTILVVLDMLNDFRSSLRLDEHRMNT